MKHDLEAVERLGFRSIFPVTPAQLRIAMLAYAGGEPVTVAAKKAGIEAAAFKLYTERDNFASDLRAVIKGLVETTYAPRAFAFLNDCVADAAMPARVRVDAAKIIIDRAGYVAAPPAAERDPGDIAGMSREELHRFVKEAEAKLATEAKDVSPIGASGPGEDESDDMPQPSP